MSAGLIVLKHQANNLRRSRWLPGYVLVLALVTDSLLRFGGAGPQTVVSLLNVVLIVVPLVSLVFGTLHLYGAREFAELLLAQPVSRGSLYAGLYGGLALPLAAGFTAGVGLPFLWGGGDQTGGPLGILLLAGVMLTLVFSGLAFLIALTFDDKARGLGAALVIWLGITALYDGFLLFVIGAFADRPLELPLIGLTLLNPVDLARILILLRLDTAVLMGYTGAVFERFFGGSAGLVVAALALLGWVALPFGAGLRRFRRKDL